MTNTAPPYQAVNEAPQTVADRSPWEFVCINNFSIDATLSPFPGMFSLELQP